MRAFLDAGAAPARRAWTVEESAVFAARRDFELLVLLSSHKKALMTARRLGFGRAAHPHAAAGKPQHHQPCERGGAGGPATASGEETVRTTARQRRSARRSALRHQRRRREHLLRTRCLLPALYLTRLRRAAAARRLQATPVRALVDATSSSPAKRSRDDEGDTDGDGAAAPLPQPFASRPGSPALAVKRVPRPVCQGARAAREFWVRAGGTPP